MKRKITASIAVLFSALLLFHSCKKEEVTYTVAFNANHGIGTMEEQIFMAEEEKALSVNTFTREGYTFAGWNTKQDGTGTTYDDQQTITVNSNMTLYAQWMQSSSTTYTVTFNNNGGNGSMATQSFQQGVPQALSANTFTREGYSFAGWNTAVNGEGTSYTNQQTITINNNIILYAQWTQSSSTTYTVTFNNNGGNGSMATQSFQQGVPQALSANTFTREGYSFAGWNTAVNGEGTSYTNQQTITINNNIILYAQWTQSFTDQTFTVNGVNFTMKPVLGGTFYMGAQSTNSGGQNYDIDAYDDYESPVHQVTVSSFYMGQYEVTQALWLAVMGSWPETAPSSELGVGDNYPAYYVSWNDIQNFITQLNALTGRTFRLPTEAEWEFAARGGNQSHGYKYSGGNTIGNVAWYTSNSSYKTHVVGSKQANELGLYDMSGNVWELCQDWYGSYGSSAQTNPQGPSSGSDRVERGGTWGSNASYCRVAFRASSTPNYRHFYVGFRLALVQ